MFERLLFALASWLLEKLYEFAEQEFFKAKNKAETDAINKANEKLYKESKDRLERVKHAKNLLNGTKP